MGEFLTPADIGNRALQRVGSPRMGTAGFSENSKRAAEVSSCYGKLRRAELGRNVWSFATRRTALRAIDSNTLFLAATLWSSQVTYFVGSIVQDGNGTYWESKIRDNLGNQPGVNFSAWHPYFGSLAVALYDSSQTYFSGEVVYTAAGDGTFNVYKSLLGSNAVHPALPNQWSVSTVYFKDQVVQQFPAWAGGTTYSKGQGILYTDGNVYASLTNGNVGNMPSATSTVWALMPALTLASQSVPITTPIVPPTSSAIIEWAQATVYSAGSFVMFNGSVYLSLVANNTGNFPNAAGSTSWVAVTNGTLSMSLIDYNLGNSPASAPALWASGTTYASGNQVGGSDGFIYTSIGSGNVGNNPVTDGGVHWTNTNVFNPWTTVTQGGGNSQWMQIGGASFPNGVGLTTPNITWPVNAGPLSQSGTRNVYRLPANYLRRAPQMPSAGNVSFLGAPTNLEPNDWEYNGNFLVSWDAAPIAFRFVADMQDVTGFTDLFCEALSCRIAVEVCEPLTQSSAKVKMAEEEYKKFVGDAITVNGIETGPDEPPLDDYLACRL